MLPAEARTHAILPTNHPPTHIIVYSILVTTYLQFFNGPCFKWFGDTGQKLAFCYRDDERLPINLTGIPGLAGISDCLPGN